MIQRPYPPLTRIGSGLRAVGWAAAGCLASAGWIILALILSGAGWVPGAIEDLTILILVPTLVAPLFGAVGSIWLGLILAIRGETDGAARLRVVASSTGIALVAWLTAMASAILLTGKTGWLAGPISAALGGSCLYHGQCRFGSARASRSRIIALGWAMGWILTWILAVWTMMLHGNPLG